MPIPPQIPPGFDFKDDSTLRRVLDGLPMAVAISTPEIDGEMKFLNKAFLQTFGYSAEEIPNVQAWAERAYPDTAYRKQVFDEWNADVARATREGGALVPMEFHVTCKDGSLRDVLFSAQAYDDMLVVSLFDITSRNQNARDLAAARAELEKTAFEVTENIPAGTYTMVLPPDGGMGRFSFMSTRFLELCGLDRAAAEQNPFNAFACVHPDDYDEWVRKNAECFEQKIPFSEECRIVANGKTRWIHAESIPRQRPDGTMIWEGVLSDITRRKEAEQQLAAAREREKRAEERERARLERKLKSSLTASAVAHEINQPLSSILLQSRLALEEAANEHPALIKIASEAQLVVRTIEKMKVLLRNVQTKHKNVNLSAVVKSSILQVEQQLAQHQILVHEEGTEKVHRMRGDEGQLQLAITNLLRNAIEAIEQAGTPHRHIHIAINPKRTMLELIIADSGPGFTKGIPAETPLNSTKLQGSGIGLYVVRTAMRNHDAKIYFARSPLGGAEIRLRFPKSVGRES